MANEQNLKGNSFRDHPERINKSGRPVGIKNRGTIAKKILEMKALMPDDVFKKLSEKYPSIKQKMTVEEVATIILADKAIEGDTQSYNALMDSAYGKARQEVENFTPPSITTINFQPQIYTTGVPIATNENDVQNG